MNNSPHYPFSHTDIRPLNMNAGQVGQTVEKDQSMRFLTTIPVCLTLAACADSGANYRPILDGPASAAYQADLAACQTLARNQNQLDQETLGATVLGAGAGAALGEFDKSGLNATHVVATGKRVYDAYRRKANWRNDLLTNRAKLAGQKIYSTIIPGEFDEPGAADDWQCARCGIEALHTH